MAADSEAAAVADLAEVVAAEVVLATGDEVVPTGGKRAKWLLFLSREHIITFFPGPFGLLSNRKKSKSQVLKNRNMSFFQYCS